MYIGETLQAKRGRCKLQKGTSPKGVVAKSEGGRSPCAQVPAPMAKSTKLTIT